MDEPSRTRYPRSAGYATQLHVLPSTTSTNDELLTYLTHDPKLPHFTVIITDHQTHGRGRLGRTWITTPGESLAISILVRTTPPPTLPHKPRELFPPESLGWFPLIAGTAVTRTLRTFFPHNPDRVTMKWPNDVLIGNHKVCGILCELVPDRSAVIIGVGINLFGTPATLPTATSLNHEIARAFIEQTIRHKTSSSERSHTPVHADSVLAGFLRELRQDCDLFIRSGGDTRNFSHPTSLGDTVRTLCGTLGRDVKIELPSRETLEGRALTLTNQGHLVVRASNGTEFTVAAGDVHHATLLH